MTLEGLNDDFRDMVVALADCGVEFVVIGAYALAFHGAPRASGDIDLFVRPSPENAKRLVTALRQFGAPLASHSITQSDFARPGTVFQIGLPPRRIDLLTEISGVTFDEALTSGVPVEVEDRRIHIIGRDAFLKNKAASGRPKDIADISRLKKLGASK
jgi:predicted nucleotidyltransferase